MKILPAIIYLIILSGIITSCSDRSEKIFMQNALLDHTLFLQNVRLSDDGSNTFADFKTELYVTPRRPENQSTINKLESFISRMDQIDKESSQIIRYIDLLKLELLRQAGEDTKFYLSNTGNTRKICWSQLDVTKSTIPIDLNLTAMKFKGNYDIPTVFFTSGEKEPSAKGLELWNNLKDYREKMVRISGTYDLNRHSYSIYPQEINDYSDEKELIQKAGKMIQNSNACLKEDGQLLSDLYILLTQKERDLSNVHWINNRFSGLPLVSVINNLSVLQNEILRARLMALAHIDSKVNYCGPSVFNTIAIQVHGPASAQPDQELELKIFMAAFRKDYIPVIKSNNGTVTEIDENGIATIHTKVKGQKEMSVSGTFSYKEPSGKTVTVPWSKKININGK